MCSWGIPSKGDKFYKGAPSDTPWNKDLLWQMHVSKETNQMKINLGEIPQCKNTKRHPKLRMGITGTLIPDIPVDPEESTLPTLRSNPSRESLNDVMSQYSSSRKRGKSRRSSRSSSMSSSSYTTNSSSSSSLRISQLQEKMENRTKQIETQSAEQISKMRQMMLEESEKRRLAERKIQMLCKKFGVDEDDDE